MSSICCMCNRKDIEESMNPVKCYLMHGSVAHKVCSICWWGKNGFASEGGNHNCPGCIKNMSLGKRIRTRTFDLSEFVIDLCDDE